MAEFWVESVLKVSNFVDVKELKCNVMGRGVKDMATNVQILWSSSSVPNTAATFSTNHFVVLHPTSEPITSST